MKQKSTQSFTTKETKIQILKNILRKLIIKMIGILKKKLTRKVNKKSKKKLTRKVNKKLKKKLMRKTSKKLKKMKDNEEEVYDYVDSDNNDEEFKQALKKLKKNIR